MTFKRNIKTLVFAVTALMLMVCMSSLIGTTANKTTAHAQTQELKIAVLSDTHYFPASYVDPYELADFAEFIGQQNSIVAESSAVFDTALKLIKADAPDVLLLTGDISKQGEYLSIREVAEKLEKLEEEIGVKVYVINGASDINNPEVASYSRGNKDTSRARTTPANFKDLNKNLGYNEAIATFTPTTGVAGGLSYVVRPQEGYTFIAVDTAKYSADVTSTQLNEAEKGGAISEELLAWIELQSANAIKRGDTVIAFQNHGVVSRFDSASFGIGDFVVDDNEMIATAYAEAGIEVVFTGGLHANDIATFTSVTTVTTGEGENEQTTEVTKTLYDIQTASIVSYPSSYRICTLSPSSNEEGADINVDVKTKFIESLTYKSPYTSQTETIEDFNAHVKDITTIDKDFLYASIMPMVNEYLADMQAQGGMLSIFAKLLGGSEETGDGENQEVTEDVDYSQLTKEEIDAIVLEGISNALKKELSERLATPIPINLSDYIDLGEFGGLTGELAYVEKSGKLKDDAIKLGSSDDLLGGFYIFVCDIAGEIKSVSEQIDTIYFNDDTSYINAQIIKLIEEIMTYKYDGIEQDLEEIINYAYLGFMLGDEVEPQWRDTLLAYFANESTDEAEESTNGIDMLLADIFRPIVNETVQTMIGSATINLNNIINTTYGILLAGYKDTAVDAMGARMGGVQNDNGHWIIPLVNFLDFASNAGDSGINVSVDSIANGIIDQYLTPEIVLMLNSAVSDILGEMLTDSNYEEDKDTAFVISGHIAEVDEGSEGGCCGGGCGTIDTTSVFTFLTFALGCSLLLFKKRTLVKQ